MTAAPVAGVVVVGVDRESGGLDGGRVDALGAQAVEDPCRGAVGLGQCARHVRCTCVDVHPERHLVRHRRHLAGPRHHHRGRGRVRPVPLVVSAAARRTCRPGRSRRRTRPAAPRRPRSRSPAFVRRSSRARFPAGPGLACSWRPPLCLSRSQVGRGRSATGSPGSGPPWPPRAVTPSRSSGHSARERSLRQGRAVTPSRPSGHSVKVERSPRQGERSPRQGRAVTPSRPSGHPSTPSGHSVRAVEATQPRPQPRAGRRNQGGLTRQTPASPGRFAWLTIQLHG